MTHFLLTFVMLLLLMLGMAVGALVAGKRIRGSCGGLNAIAGADKCLVCKQSVDPDSPLRERFECPKRGRTGGQAQTANPQTNVQTLRRLVRADDRTTR